ncbi:MAG: hypothetical protein RIR88_887 [Actinomycetota bacterium]
MAQRTALPTTTVGRWGLRLIVSATILILVSMAVAFVRNATQSEVAVNALWVLGPVFVAVTICALVVSWLAILRFRDRSVLLLIFAIALTLATMLAITGEIIEAVRMSGI